MADQKISEKYPIATSQLRAIQPRDSRAALGMSVAFLMGDPAFARLPFGHWSRVLVGQINRRHFVFVVDGSQTAGFAGWAFASKAKAEAWLAGGQDLNFGDSQSGEIVIVNAWKATTPAAHRSLVDVVRRVIRTKDAVYYKRSYGDGRVRPVRLPVNEFVQAHVFRDSSGKSIEQRATETQRP